MYINFPLLESYGLIPEDAICLQVIFQNKFEDNSDLIAAICNTEKFEQFELISYIKGTKKASKESLMRLSPKGIKILEDIQIPAVNQDDLDVSDWIKGIYKSSNKEVGNLKNLKTHISLFRSNSGIERNHLAFLIKSFINDEDNFKYSQRADYLIWKPENVFQTKFSLDSSKLYQYYLKRKDYFDDKFNKIIN